MRNLVFLKRVKLLLCLICFPFLFVSCRSVSNINPAAIGWELNILMDKGYRIEVAEGNLVVISQSDESMEPKSYRFLFNRNGYNKMNAVREKLMAIGVLRIEVSQIEND